MGSYKKMSKGGKSDDSYGKNFEEFASSDTLGGHVEVKSGKNNVDETNKKAPVSSRKKSFLGST